MGYKPDDNTYLFLEDHIEFQNRFGAWARMVYEYEHNIRERVVNRVSIAPRAQVLQYQKTLGE